MARKLMWTVAAPRARRAQSTRHIRLCIRADLLGRQMPVFHQGLYRAMHRVWNGGTSGASYTFGSLQAGASDQCSSSEVCAQTDATTWQCLPNPGVGAPTGGDGCAGTMQSPGCPAGTFCWNGKCVCNGVDPSSVTGSGPCPDGSFCTRFATGSKDTSGNSYYTYRCCTDMARQCGGQCGPCPRNGFCSSTADCASGYYCEPATHQCTYYCSSGGADSASGCPNNQVCDLRADNPDTSKQQSILCYCTRGQCLGSDGECYKDNAHCGYSGDWYPQCVCGSIANSQVDCTTLSGCTCTLTGGQYRCCNADNTNCV
ncbi:GCC2 and GCC3 domain-containing [Chlorella sorokiniana]|uniref:GCC2 and GCC3 domain-containing n=1 Tax=Chlorella sorokiniana TaxID=3076 RepID=A0A2P6THE2_CHLSO|nr:GCC2 and GCC3 domain-containing [Chlorella sorokiniana]|eukprot:PRW33705.1 GCC2 and GCC3 domain-containing [Chlorella sorokiniana]